MRSLGLVEEINHGRKESRTAVVVSAKGLAEHHEFPSLKAFGRVEATREGDGKVTSDTRYFALSWKPTPEVLMATVRAHWAIENTLHWQLDVSFREDAARNRKDNAPASIAILRRRALNVVRRDTSKGSLSMNDHRLKVGGFRLRLKAGSVRHAADLFFQGKPPFPSIEVHRKSLPPLANIITRMQFRFVA